MDPRGDRKTQVEKATFNPLPSPPLPSPRATADRQASRLSWTQIDGTNEKVSTDRLALKAVPGLGVLSLAPPPSFPPRPSHADLAVCRQPFSFHSLHIKDLAYFLPPSILTRLGITTIASHLKEMERKTKPSKTPKSAGGAESVNGYEGFCCRCWWWWWWWWWLLLLLTLGLC
ncbi:uncharacterized protein BO72DRAFT_265956 [Aspergillus fijiensis CBS 313.89]|uniref:Uncharacterized protein n=1 Tax=Aspergillus fijiensis CBS 313.89 TaxID=1448319 RepID=A0A8G1W200_9EURO|nr:uncharacterized protein BO72DRAFT_265956 [Aspergillus fijiensis CBS 313.89]RAK80987.1 hypothetical protein BO72DRAFT_265956 [Aspergillus fijiensis CBS 313.89]